jgi:hypothetical protein
MKKEHEGLRDVPAEPTVIARPSTPLCRECRHFLDYSETDPAEPVGYCSHPLHFTPASPHHEYGGHWAWSYKTCEMGEPK